jgi:hypothetical protein
MDIPQPPGYGSAVPFDKDKHRRLGVATRRALFARRLNFIYVTTAEFPRASRDYPIAFVRDGLGVAVPVIITGLDSGTNLFIDEAGTWSANHYCPAYVRRYPFFTVTLENAGNPAGEALICVDEGALVGGVDNLIDASGQPTAAWREFEVLITEMDREQRVTERFCQSIDELDLFEPFDADFHPRGKRPVRVAGLMRVNEQRLLKLEESVQVSLLRDGHLARIYAHLLSLENFNRLLDRYVD